MPLISVYLEAEVLRLACYRESSSSDRAAVKYCLKRGVGGCILSPTMMCLLFYLTELKTLSKLGRWHTPLILGDRRQASEFKANLV